MRFKKFNNDSEIISKKTIYLRFNDWDDYSYCTGFSAYYLNEKEKTIYLGNIKIGCKELWKKVPEGKSVNGFSSYSIDILIPDEFESLDESFFSLGQDIDFYKKINEVLKADSVKYFEALRDLAYDYEKFKLLYENNESILVNSLMRNIFISDIQQFSRISKGELELTKYNLEFKYNDQKMDIYVNPNSLPPTNIHVIIGRNGVGKTWLLHNILFRLLENSKIEKENFLNSNKYSVNNKFSIEAPTNSFAGIIGISFSIFDDALSLKIKEEKKIDEKKIDEINKNYKYIGLIKNNDKEIKIKSGDEIRDEFISSLKKIKSKKSLIKIYLEMCDHLKTDDMFDNDGFIELLEKYLNNINYDYNDVKENFSKLSSGHMVIMLSLTLLTESIHEKTIVLIDEPETHLHPPLLSTYMRALSFLLLKRNAVAIVCTHSPIVLQEVPKSCVNKLTRIKSDMKFKKIDIESFGTNIDSLTREVFGLEILKTGFYKFIESELETSFEKTLKKFEGNIGGLGQMLIQSLVSLKRNKNEEN